MSKVKILLYLLIFFSLNGCNLNELRSKYSQNEFILNTYVTVQQKLKQFEKFLDNNIEILLLKVSKEHKDYWKVEDREKRNQLPEFKYRETEKNQTISLGKNEHTLNNWYRSHGNQSSNRFSEQELINAENVKNLDIDEATAIQNAEDGFKTLKADTTFFEGDDPTGPVKITSQKQLNDLHHVFWCCREP